jgi:23S rRNA pseudouridine1911/1915/1917 synthase
LIVCTKTNTSSWYSGTLVNALLYHCPDLKGIGGALRPGIVHRLDKDTSGALVVAKSAEAHEHLARQFKARTIQKTYLALVYGEFDETDGTIRLAIGRHPTDRKRMSTKSRKRREAETQWNICEQFKGITLLELYLKTGRTHQIRVHCAAMDHPIVGDPVYRPRKLLKNITKTYSTLTEKYYKNLLNPSQVYGRRGESREKTDAACLASGIYPSGFRRVHDI